jgi:hypothetical protein
MYTPPLAYGVSASHVPRAHPMAVSSIAGSVQPASMLTLNTSDRCGKALSSAPTRATAPPRVRIAISVSGVGRRASHSSIAAIAASGSASIAWDFM